MNFPEATRPSSDNIFANFIACVRSRRGDQLCASIEDGHISSALCHFGNLSYRLGHDASFLPKPKLANDNPAFGETYDKMEEHLVAAKVELGNSKLRIGKLLTLQGEQIVNIDEDHALLARKYRAPFLLPEKL